MFGVESFSRKPKSGEEASPESEAVAGNAEKRQSEGLLDTSARNEYGPKTPEQIEALRLELERLIGRE